MNEPINPDLLSEERLADESTRAYRAFCIYRDLGPGRSIDRAWRRFRADQQKEHGAAMRRPGHWASWAMKFNWVDRAEAYDDLLDKERRAAGAESHRQLQADRAQFERDDHQRQVKRVLEMDDGLERLANAPMTEVTQVKRDEATGKKTTTKVVAFKGRDYSPLMKTRNDTTRRIVEGYAPVERYAPKDKDTVKDERKIERVVWVSAKNRNSARPSHTDFRTGHGESIVDMDADREVEEDKAA